MAVSASKKQEIQSIRQAARLYDVPYTTLHNRLHGSINRTEQRANGHKLTITEEDTLVQWISSMDKRGATPRPVAVQDMANILLSERGLTTSPIQVGKNWVHNFISRRDELKTRFSRRYNYQRAKCEDPKVICEWFDLVQRTIMEYGILQEDIYNFDETGFGMGLIATAKVVTRADIYGRPSLLPGNREWVTTIESINAMGWALSSCIIFKAKTHQQSWYEEPSLPHDWMIETSPNGWTTNEIGISWLQKLFIPSTTARTKGRYRMLVLDGHGSHLTPQFDKICTENNIIPIYMPPHSSHLLQPLDVGCFAVLKRAYGRMVEDKMRLGINHIDKLDFLAAYPHARAETYKPENLINGFAATGLVPFNPDRVLVQLNIRLKTPTPPGSRSSNPQASWVPGTPHNIVELERQATAIKGFLKQRTRSFPSPTNAALNQLIKGCQLAMNSAVILGKENRELRAANERQKQKRRRSNKQISHTGGLSLQEARDLIESRNQVPEAPVASGVETAAPASPPRTRAPTRCSDCRIIGHRRLQCPNRNIS